MRDARITHPGGGVDFLTQRDLFREGDEVERVCLCLLYTSDAADERSSVDLGGRRIIKKKNTHDKVCGRRLIATKESM